MESETVFEHELALLVALQVFSIKEEGGVVHNERSRNNCLPNETQTQIY